MTAPSAQQRAQWEEEGYLVVEQAIAGEQLRRLQTAFDHWSDACRDGWIADIERGEAPPMWYDIPDPLEKDDVFIDLVDHPSYYPMVTAFCGGEAVLYGKPQAKTVPCWPVSYTGWHPDRADDGSRQVKMQIYVNDVPPHSGEFAYVPGSHTTRPGTYYRTGRNETMPGHVTFPGAAGMAILFDNRGLHTAMDNTTSVPRKSIFLSFHERGPGTSDHFAAITDRLQTPERRRLFGLE